MSNPLETMIDDIIARIERGVPPWRQPWAKGGNPSLPLRSTGEPFTGANVWMLAFAAAEKGYAAPYWFTFQQALAIGACVRAGERSTKVVLYKQRTVSDDPDESGAGDPRILRFMKSYSVFNAEQLDQCPAEYLKVPAVSAERRTAIVNGFVDAIPYRVVHGGDVACYSPALDLIRMPHPEAFRTPDDYLATRLHEAVHATGHSDRLAREFGKTFGDQAYAAEELVAELASAFLGLRIGLAPQLMDSHAAYLAHWASMLKERPNALMSASARAQEAVDLLSSYSAGALASAEAA